MERTRRAMAVGVAVTAIFACVEASAVAPASASSGYVSPYKTWDTHGTTLAISGGAYIHNYLCAAGLKECMHESRTGFESLNLGGDGTSNSNATEVSAVTSVSGFGISVSLSSSAIGAGFTASGTSCRHGDWYGSKTFDDVEIPSTTVTCEASTYGAITHTTLTVSGGARFGGTWEVNSTSDSKSY